MIFTNKKGMSLIISMLLLIGTAIVIGVAYYTWSNSVYNDVTSEITPTIKSSVGNMITPMDISTIDTYYFTNMDTNNDDKISNNPEERFVQTIKLDFINNLNEDLAVNARIYCLTQNVSWASLNIDKNNNNLLLDRNGNPYNYSGNNIYFNGTSDYSSMKFYDENGELYYAATSNGSAINTSNLTDLINLDAPSKSFSINGNSKKIVCYYILINSTKVPNTILFKIVASTKYGDVEKTVSFEVS